MTARDLQPYVPRIALELADRTGNVGLPVEGALLSADISGFTALSERLAAKGKAGAEEITDLINRCFSALIEAAYEFDGEVVKFGGDALLVLFRGDRSERRALNAAQSMQLALTRSTAAKRASLTMTVGVAEGPFDVFLVGTNYRELLISGPAATEVIRLESAAASGETLVSEAIARSFTEETHDGGFVVGGPWTDVSGPSPIADGHTDLTSFVPVSVANELAAFEDLGGEHRIVTVGFVMLTGIAELLAAEGRSAVADALGDFVDRLIANCDPFAVTSLHTDIAPDGVKFVLVAGAPTTIGNTSDALAQAALAIAAIETPFVIRQGVQRGRVFAGFLGADYRRTYTLMGDPVNTAARMLGPAGDGEIVVVDDVLSDTRTPFVTEALEPLMVKGKTEPIQAHRLVAMGIGGTAGEESNRLVGRDNELDHLDRLLDAPGRTTELSGGAGSGKSRLVEALRSRAERSGVASISASCTPYGAQAPYALMRPLLRSVIGCAAVIDRRAVGARLAEVVAEHAPELRALLPLLAVPIGAEVDDTAEASAIEPDFRRGRTHDATVSLLRAVLDHRVLFVFEDLQWVDEASGELLHLILRTAKDQPWSAIVTRRTGDDGWMIDTAVGETTSVELGALPDDAIHQLAIDECSRALSDRELELVVERASGNPLFAIELARAMDVGDNSALPDSVEQLIATRIDALPPAQRRFVRTAAVFGRRFSGDDVGAVVAAEGDGSSVDPAELPDLLEGRGNGVWEFANGLYRDAAYEGLPFKRRRNLHELAGLRLEERQADPNAIADLLTVHFSEARDHERTWRYGVVAADQAAAQSAHADAVANYEHALAATRYLSIDDGDRGPIAVRMGDAAERSGFYEKARAAYKRAQGWLPKGELKHLELFRKHGVVCEREGNYSRALRWYGRGLDASAETFGAGSMGEVYELELAIAGIRFRRGEYAQCWDQAAPIAKDQAAGKRSQMRANYLMQLAGTYLGREDAEKHGALALALAPEVDDPVLEGNLLNNLGIAAYYAGSWDDAAALYDRSLDMRERAGDVAGSVMSLNNLGELRSDQGRVEDAEQLLTDGLRRAEAAGYAVAVALLISNLGRLARRRGDLDSARDLLDDALARFTELGSEEFATDTRMRHVELAIAAGDYGRALEGAIELLDETETPSTVAPLRRLIGTARRLSGDAVYAQADLREAAEVAREADLMFDEALALDQLSRAGGGDESGERAQATFTRIGVTGTPAAWLGAE